MRKNIFVLGLDETNRAPLEHIYGAESYRFHQLLALSELQDGHIELKAPLEKARAQLDAFDGTIDAVVGYWDFPVSSMVPLLCRRYGLRSAELTAVVRCEHKYWCRLEQQKVIDEYPAFALVDLEHDTSLPEGFDYPAWVKPVKSFSSALAYQVGNDEELAQALGEIRNRIDQVGDAFDHLLEYVDLPDEIARVGGRACLVEESVTGGQLTIEGYSVGTEVHIYGAIDSVTYPDCPSFLRYQYPSTLPQRIITRASDLSRALVARLGLDSVAFNVEFFVDPERETLTVLEVNPRHSQSHARLFEYVDGIPNHQCMVRLALGLDPQLPYGEGPYRHAAKWFFRRFTDGTVRRCPSAAEIDSIEEQVPGVAVKIAASEGMRLSDADRQDSYSYELAHVFIGANSEAELAEKYERCIAGLPFEFDD